MSELYAGPLLARAPAYSELPSDLPGLGDLADYERVSLGVEQIGAELHLLAGSFGNAGLGSPTLPASLVARGGEGEAKDVKRDLFLFHLELLEKLTAIDFRLGKAYGLGRALADTSLLPDAKEPEGFTHAFREERLEVLTAWLGDLRSSFPTYAAAATSHSLSAWGAWVAAATRDGQPVAPKGGEAPTRALRAQGRLWRGLLSGERLSTDLLSTEDYVSAARAMVRNTARIAGTFLKTWRWWVVGGLLILAGLLYLVFTHLSGSSKTVTALITFVGAVGLSWKGVSASLGKVITKAEPHLWDTEVQAAVCQAATRLPTTERQ